MSTSSNPDDTGTDSDSTRDGQSITSQTSLASDRSLRPRVPISYNETLLQRLHGRPQVKTLNTYQFPCQIPVMKTLRVQLMKIHKTQLKPHKKRNAKTQIP